MEAFLLDKDRFEMYVRLSSRLTDGRWVSSVVREDFRWSGLKHGLGAIFYRYRGPQLSTDAVEELRLLRRDYRVRVTDVEDAVNAMLGRDPDQEPPARLGWDGLQRALEGVGVEVDEAALIDCPLELRLTDEVLAMVAEGHVSSSP